MKKLFTGLTFILFITQPARAYVNGVDAKKALHGVVKINGYCTGSLVAPSKVLLASHCSIPGDLEPGASVHLLNSDGEEKESTVARFLPYAVWPQEKLSLTGYDIAILVLTENIGWPLAHIDPKPVNVGNEVIIGGYGIQNQPVLGLNPQTSLTLTVAKKRISKILRYQFSVGIYDSDRQQMSIGAKGDSGGPAFRWNQTTNRYEVIGVNHSVTHRIDELHFNEKGVLISFLKKEDEPEFYVTKFSPVILQWLRQTLKL